MLKFANQYSYFLTGILLLLVAAGLLAWRRHGLHRAEIGVLILMAAVIGLGWLASRPANVKPVSIEQIRAQIGKGTPLLLEFQSPY